MKLSMRSSRPSLARGRADANAPTRRWPRRIATIAGSIALVFLLAAPADGPRADFLDRGRIGKLVFSDEFDRMPATWSEPPRGRAKWRTRYAHSGDTPLSRGLGMNGSESQIYVDPGYLDMGIQPLSVAGGVLTITAAPASPRVRATVRAATPRDYAFAREPRFTSGLLTTEASLFRRYGYVEARIQVPGAPGTWPALWLLGQNGQPHQEIDIFEILGSEKGVLHASAHSEYDRNGRPVKPREARAREVPTGDLSRRFHTYGLLWTPREIVWYLDGRQIFRTDNFGFDRPANLLVNLAMDGSWNAQRNFRADPRRSARMRIDYIRVYALAQPDGSSSRSAP